MGEKKRQGQWRSRVVSSLFHHGRGGEGVQFQSDRRGFIRENWLGSRGRVGKVYEGSGGTVSVSPLSDGSSKEDV